MPAPLLAEAKGYAESSFDTWPAGNWPARFLFARKSQSALPCYTEPALECERVGNAIELRGS